MMRSERKTEKWRIPGKWTLIFLLILLAFYGYQNILAEKYERQAVSWIGQTEKDRTVSVFTEPDEEVPPWKHLPRSHKRSSVSLRSVQTAGRSPV